MRKRCFSVLTFVTILPACDQVPVETGQPKLLQPFVEDHGRILAVPSASDYGDFHVGKSNRLQRILYNNGITDLYSYDDENGIVEVIRDDLILQRHFVIMAAETGVLDAPNAVSEAPKDHVAL